jgi:hypothetical protein
MKGLAMSRISIGIAVVAAVGLLAFGLVVRAAQAPVVPTPRIVSMEEGGRAMEAAGLAMQRHASAMITGAQGDGDVELIAFAERWQRDGELVEQRGRWMAMNPTAADSLVSSQSALAATGQWGSLTTAAQAMTHDPSRMHGADVGALGWNGRAMTAEGRVMAEHGRVMLGEIELMLAQGRHSSVSPAIGELRSAAETIERVGGDVESNGQAMVDYAQRVRTSLGYRD